MISQDHNTDDIKNKIISRLLACGVKPTKSTVQVIYENETATSISFHRGGPPNSITRYMDSSEHISITTGPIVLNDDLRSR